MSVPGTTGRLGFLSAEGRPAQAPRPQTAADGRSCYDAVKLDFYESAVWVKCKIKLQQQRCYGVFHWRRVVGGWVWCLSAGVWQQPLLFLSKQGESLSSPPLSLPLPQWACKNLLNLSAPFWFASARLAMNTHLHLRWRVKVYVSFPETGSARGFFPQPTDWLTDQLILAGNGCITFNYNQFQDHIRSTTLSDYVCQGNECNPESLICHVCCSVC